MSQTTLVPLDLVDPGDNDRKQFDEDKLRELAASIAAEGLLQPPVYRPVGNRFQIVAGERRTRAVKLLGWTHVQAVVREMDDETASSIMLAENVQRQDLSPIEEARAYQARIDQFGWSIPELAKRANVSDSKVRGRLRLLKLSDVVQQSIASGDIPLAFAEILETLDIPRQIEALKWVSRQKATPTRSQLGDYTAVLRQRMYEEATVSIFSLDEYTTAERIMQQSDGKLSPMLPRVEGLPDVRWEPGAIAVGNLFDFYICDLLDRGLDYEARVIADFWSKAMEANYARLAPIDSRIARRYPEFLDEKKTCVSPAYEM